MQHAAGVFREDVTLTESVLPGSGKGKGDEAGSRCADLRQERQASQSSGQIFNLASQGYVTIRHLFGYRGRLNRHDYETFSAVVTACSASFRTSESFELVKTVKNRSRPSTGHMPCVMYL